VVISPQREIYQAQVVKKHNLTFEVLRDEGNRVAEQFGLRFQLPDDLKEVYRSFEIDLERYNGDDSWALPLPGRFIIDAEGTIRAVDVDPDYTVRPEPTGIMEIIRSLK
jgi:peroxiredoxin